MVMPLLVLLVEIFLLHLVEMLVDTLLLHSVVVPHHPRYNSPTNLEDQCLGMLHLLLSRSVSPIHAISEMRKCTMVAIGTR